MPTSSKIASDAATGARARIGRRRGRPAGGALGRDERSEGVEPDVRVEPPPAAQPRQRPVAGVTLVDEDRPDRARAAVEVLVRAPRGEVDVPVVERELDVAGGVGQVPADDGAGGVAGGGQPLDLEGLAGREVDARQEDEREVAGRARAMAASRSSVRTVCSPARGPTTTRSAPGSRPRHARWVVRAWRSDGKSGPSARIRRRRPSGRKNEASSRWMSTVRLLSSATSAGRAPTTRAIASRSEPSSVNHGRSGSNQASTPRRAQASSSRRDGGRGRPWLQPERLAGEVDRPAIRRARPGCGTGRASTASASQPRRASGASSLGHGPVSGVGGDFANGG